MNAIKIKQNIRLPDIDNLYISLYKGISKAEKIDIILPKSLSKNFFSLTSSLIQFVATWIRYKNANRLIVDIDNENENENGIMKMYEEEFLFPIIALAWNDVSIENINGKNLRPLLRDYQNKFILKMRKIEAMKGEKLLLVNLDHFDQNNGLLPFFETKNSFIVNEKNLIDSLKDPILNNVLKYSKNAKNDFELIYNDIIGIIYELMKNTYEWARDNEFQIPFSPNIRGLFIRFYKKNRANVLKDYKDEGAIFDFFENVDVVRSNELNQVYFIEVSVFDSGSGFVKKFSSSDSGDLAQVDIIKKCLVKNHTSSKSIFKNEKGLGLDRILKILNNKGLLRIKTDKYCLYRNLVNEPYKEIEIGNYKQMELYDWNSHSNLEYSELDDCSGSNISILYPLPSK